MKAEILAELTTKGELSSFRHSPTWEKAFAAYNAVHTQKKRMGCSSCYRDVLAWLRLN